MRSRLVLWGLVVVGLFGLINCGDEEPVWPYTALAVGDAPLLPAVRGTNETFLAGIAIDADGDAVLDGIDWDGEATTVELPLVATDKPGVYAVDTDGDRVPDFYLFHKKDGTILLNTARDALGRAVRIVVVDTKTVTGFDTDGDGQADLALPFTISYVLAGGTNHAGNPLVYSVQSPTITLQPATRSGWSFIGWFADAGFTLPVSEIVQGSYGHRELFARWTNHGISYVGNGHDGGAVPVDPARYPTGGEAIVLGNTNGLVKSAHTFIGWNTRSDGNGTGYMVNDRLVFGASNVVLYAVWTSSPTYTVSYNGNGHDSGTVPVDVNQYLQGAAFNAAMAGTMVKEGYVFTGWNTQADGSGTPYGAGISYPMGDSNLILYARWAAVYMVSYHGNGNTGGSAPQDANRYEQGASVNAAGAGSLVKTGHGFGGWNTMADGSGSARPAGQPFTMGASDVTLYAKWNPSVYTVSFNAMGGSTPNPTSKNVAYGSAYGDLPGTSRTGYGFIGWRTGSNGSGTPVTAATVFYGTGPQTLYAHWNPNQYTITYNVNGSVGGTAPANQTIYYDVSTYVSKNSGGLYKSDRVFAGWNTSSLGTGTDYLPETSYRFYGNMTLYAKWVVPEGKTWHSVATSSDGTRLAAVAANKRIYYSSDSGGTWICRDEARDWRAIASSSSGQKLIAANYDGMIHTSSDYGTTWTARFGNKKWFAVTSSADGTRLVAVANIGPLYTSSDSGVNWHERLSPGSWVSLASSSDGMRVVGTVYGGRIWTSSNYGVDWTARTGNGNWRAIASSADGSKLITTYYGHNLWTSTDYGASWTARTSERNWRAVASSSDGQKLVAVDYGGYIYTSTNSGVNWTTRSVKGYWVSVASSSDGSKLVVVNWGGSLYTSSDSGANWILRL